MTASDKLDGPFATARVALEESVVSLVASEDYDDVRIPVKPATQSGESGHPVGAKRRWGFHDVSGGRFESM